MHFLTLALIMTFDVYWAQFCQNDEIKMAHTHLH